MGWPAPSPGWPLEAIGDDRRKRDDRPRQNPAYGLVGDESPARAGLSSFLALMTTATAGLRSRFQEVRHAYRHHVRELGQEPRLLGALAFLIAFLAVRIITHAIRNHLGPFQDIEAANVHIHHVVPGLVLVLLAGLLDLVDEARRVRALLFGVGAALVLDEFALVLNLADVYWAPQGRESIDAVVIFAAVLLVFALGGGFWRAAWHAVTRH